MKTFVLALVFALVAQSAIAANKIIHFYNYTQAPAVIRVERGTLVDGAFSPSGLPFIVSVKPKPYGSPPQDHTVQNFDSGLIRLSTFNAFYSPRGASFVADTEGNWAPFGSYIEPGGADAVRQVGTGLNPTPTQDYEKTLWTVGDSTLTADLYREGVDKITAQITRDAGSGSGSAGGMSLTEFATTNTEAVSALQKYSYDHPKTAPAFDTSAEVAAASAAISEAYSARTVTAPGTAASGDGGALQFGYSMFGHTYTFDFNPFHQSNWTVFGNWLRAAISWLAFALFQFFLWRYLNQCLNSIFLMQPSKGNPVVGGTGAQATSLIVAVALTGILISVPSIYWTLADTNTTWFTGDWTQNPIQLAAGGGALGAAVELVNWALPVGTLISCLTSYLFILRGGMIMVAGINALIRYLVF